MRKIIEFNKEIRAIKKEIRQKTKKDFSSIIKKIEDQHKYLFQFVFNFTEWEIGIEDSLRENSYLYFIINLFSDSLHSAKIAKKMIMEGEYSVAGVLLRNMFETMLLLEHLTKNPSLWEDWFKYQQLSEERIWKDLKKEESKRFKDIKPKFLTYTLIGESKDYKVVYRYLCSFIHPSMERLRRISYATEKGFYIRYAPKFDVDITRNHFKYLFQIIDTIYLYFINAIKIKKKPTILKKYEKIKVRVV